MTRVHATLPALALAAAGTLAAAQDAAPTPERVMQAILAQSGLDAAALAVPDAEGPTLVSIDFSFDMPPDGFVAQMEESAPLLAHMPGLMWKVWSWDPEAGRANGTYLFASRAAADAYVARVFPAGPPSRDGYADFAVTTLRVMAGPSRATRAPLD